MKTSRARWPTSVSSISGPYPLPGFAGQARLLQSGVDDLHLSLESVPADQRDGALRVARVVVERDQVAAADRVQRVAEDE